MRAYRLSVGGLSVDASAKASQLPTAKTKAAEQAAARMQRLAALMIRSRVADGCNSEFLHCAVLISMQKPLSKWMYALNPAAIVRSTRTSQALLAVLLLSAGAANSETAAPLAGPAAAHAATTVSAPATQVVPVGDLGNTPRQPPSAPAYTSPDSVAPAYAGVDRVPVLGAAPADLASRLTREVGKRFGGSRLLATGGISPLEGAGGGGIVPWALISGLGDRDQIGGSAYYTQVNPTDFSLRSSGGALGFYNRLELSFAHLDFGLGTTVPDRSIRLDVYGAKLRLFGDAVYDQDRWWPQVAIGVQHKQNKDYDFIPKAIGARRADDNDYYLAATKVWLGGLYGRTVVADLTLRATRANQLGILGFGGDRSDAYRYLPEASLGVFLADHWILGGEYRMKPDTLSAFREDDYKDIFLVWLPTKRLSLTAAWAFLGNIADKDEQRALYLSGQLAF